jgi:hypothetical protein
MTFISGIKIIATGHTISEKILWQILNLPLLALLFVKKLVFVILMSVISEILFYHRIHL